MSIHEDIAEFFHSYVDAFNREDAAALGDLWDAVGLFPSPTGNFAMEREAFRAHCLGLMEFYRRQGVMRAEARVLSATELFPNVAQARLAWRMRGDEDDLIAAWEHVYILRRSDRWRVSLTIADGEMAAWAAKGAWL
jgi:ketosteroid isomerase-like protein